MQPPIDPYNLNIMRIVLFVLAMVFGFAYPHSMLYWVIWLVVSGLEIYGFLAFKDRGVINYISLFLSLVYIAFFALIFIGM